MAKIKEKIIKRAAVPFNKYDTHSNDEQNSAGNKEPPVNQAASEQKQFQQEQHDRQSDGNLFAADGQKPGHKSAAPQKP